jgi:hypothetical protein
MGFTKAELVREAPVVLVYELYFEKNEDGTPKLDEAGRRIQTKFRFPFLISRKADADLYEAERALGGGKKFTDLDKLARLLLREPEGFDDFPIDERPLADRVREYFAGDMEGWASDALVYRTNLIYPTPLFPGN